MTKSELIKYIEELDCEWFDLIRDLKRPQQELTTSDMRTGGIYPPSPFTPHTLIVPEEISLHITGYLKAQL